MIRCMEVFVQKYVHFVDVINKEIIPKDNLSDLLGILNNKYKYPSSFPPNDYKNPYECEAIWQIFPDYPTCNSNPIISLNEISSKHISDNIITNVPGLSNTTITTTLDKDWFNNLPDSAITYETLTKNDFIDEYGDTLTTSQLINLMK